MWPPDWIIVLLIGGAVGVLPGLFGVGGGFIMVPALHVLAGIPLSVAVGSSVCQSLGPITTGIMHRHHTKGLYVQLATVMLGGMVVGLMLGLWFLEWAETGGTRQINGREIPWIDFVLLVGYLLLLTVLGIISTLEWFYTRGQARKPRRGWLDGLKIPPFVRLPEIEGRKTSLPVVITLGVAVGFLTGGLGMGGALVLVPALVFLIGVPTQRAISVTLVAAWFTAVGATCGHAYHQNIDLALVCLLLFGGAIGAKLGSIIGQRLSGHRLRGYFSLVIAAAALMVAWHLIQLVWG